MVPSRALQESIMRPFRASQYLPRRPSYIISRASQEPLAKPFGASPEPFLSRASQELLQSISRASLEALQSLPRSSCNAPESFTITPDEVAQRMPRASLPGIPSRLLRASLEAFQNLAGGFPEALQNPLGTLPQGTPGLLKSLSGPPSELLMSFS